MATIHRFETTEDAYDQSQCRDDIKDGDILVAGQSVAVLVGAWPTLVKGPAGQFHTTHDDAWVTLGGKYQEPRRIALEIDTFPTPLEVITDRIHDANEAIHKTLEELQTQISWCGTNNKPDLRRSLEAAYRGTLDRWGEVDKLRMALKDAKFKWEQHEYAKKHGILDSEVTDHQLRASIAETEDYLQRHRDTEA